MTNKAVFWDRDGTLVKHHDYLTNVDDVALVNGAASAIKYLADRKFKAVVVTNQSAVARGMITEKDLAEINRRFISLLTRQGAVVDKLYYCPFHPDAPVEEYRKDSDLRKPAPGMLLKAADELNLDLAKCWMVGDDDRDILAGQAAGCRTILIQQRSTELVQRGGSKPDFIACSPQEAANLIAHHSKEDNIAQPPKPASDNSGKSQPEPSSGQPMAVPAPEPAQPEPVTPEPVQVEPQKQQVKESQKEGGSHIASSEPVKPTVNRSKKSKKNKNAFDRKPVQSEPEMNETQETTTASLNTAVSSRDVSEKQLLQEILRELKTHNIREEDSRGDFSGASLLAGITQIVVLFCLVMAYIASTGDPVVFDKVHAWLLSGLVFQAMTLSLLMMNSR